MSIYDSKEKINPVRDRGSLRALAVSNGVKDFIKSKQGRDIWVVLVVLLVGLLAFGLGRLSARTHGIDIQYSNSLGASAASGAEKARVFLANNPTLDRTALTVEKAYFASSRGKKYYSVGCSAGNSIKPANRVYFKTAAEAESAGYTASSSCN